MKHSFFRTTGGFTVAVRQEHIMRGRYTCTVTDVSGRVVHVWRDDNKLWLFSQALAEASRALEQLNDSRDLAIAEGRERE